MKVRGNRVLITGGSSGIGLALAEKFVTEQNEVIVTGRNAERLLESKNRIPGIRTQVADMSDVADLKYLAETYPNINILINNAGVQHNNRFSSVDYSVDAIREELEINLIGPVLLSKLYCEKWAKNSAEAAIVNVSSGLAIVPKQSAPVYCASKAGLHIFSRSLRWQLEGSGIQLFEIIPPMVDTAMTENRVGAKISPTQLVEEFWKAFRRDKFEVRIAKVKLLAAIQRFAPAIADRIMR
jgi:short-subunit dehydrogenase involved in D-alanine esterification of teichoic acids